MIAVRNPNTMPRTNIPPPIGANRSSAANTPRRARTSPERATAPESIPWPTKIETATNMHAMCRNFQIVAASMPRCYFASVGTMPVGQVSRSRITTGISRVVRV